MASLAKCRTGEVWDDVKVNLLMDAWLNSEIWCKHEIWNPKETVNDVGADSGINGGRAGIQHVADPLVGRAPTESWKHSAFPTLKSGIASWETTSSKINGQKRRRRVRIAASDSIESGILDPPYRATTILQPKHPFQYIATIIAGRQRTDVFH